MYFPKPLRTVKSVKNYRFTSVGSCLAGLYRHHCSTEGTEGRGRGVLPWGKTHKTRLSQTSFLRLLLSLLAELCTEIRGTNLQVATPSRWPLQGGESTVLTSHFNSFKKYAWFSGSLCIYRGSQTPQPAKVSLAA